jgi:membrane-associated phospholipid phosphatase
VLSGAGPGAGGRHRAAERGEAVASRRGELLPRGLRAAAVVVAMLAASVVAGLAIRYAGDSTPGRVDGHLDRAVDALPGHRIARMVIVLGSPGVVAVAAVVVTVICLLARRPRGAALAVAGPGVTGLVTTFGKPLVDRTIGHAGELAFPSGHTGGATSIALVVALLVAAAAGLGVGGTAALAAVCAIGAGGVVGTGMIIGGAHYPTDVVGGFCTAVAAVLVVALVLDAVTRRRGPALT